MPGGQQQPNQPLQPPVQGVPFQPPPPAGYPTQPPAGYPPQQIGYPPQPGELFIFHIKYLCMYSTISYSRTVAHTVRLLFLGKNSPCVC